jgi:threonine synthase
VPGRRIDTAAAVRAAAASAFYASHNWQPVFIHGVMTWALEVWEQLGFRAPHNLIMPVGNGSLLLGAAKAFALLRAAGEVLALPRLFAVQAAAFAPLVAAIAADRDDVAPVAGGTTIAEGVAIPQPVRGAALLQALRASGGTAVAVGDDEVMTAIRGLAREGMYVEPTGAVGAAGFARLVREGRIAPDETTVIILTGSGLKATAQVASWIDSPPSSYPMLPGSAAPC